MITELFSVFFGCRHSRYSFPITVRPGSRRNTAASLTGTYVACLDCGREFAYDWQEMKIITSSEEQRHRVTSLAPKAVS